MKLLASHSTSAFLRQGILDCPALEKPVLVGQNALGQPFGQCQPVFGVGEVTGFFGMGAIAKLNEHRWHLRAKQYMERRGFDAIIAYSILAFFQPEKAIR